MTVRSRPLAILAGIILAGCTGEGRQVSSSPAPPPSARASLDDSGQLKHKIECRKLGVEADREGFPEGKNTVESLNQGFIHYDSVYTYNEQLNTCVMLSGFQLTNLKTKALATYQATITDLLSNKMLATYLVLGGALAPASTSKSFFLRRARDLFGEPLPKWLEQAPGT